MASTELLNLTKKYLQESNCLLMSRRKPPVFYPLILSTLFLMLTFKATVEYFNKTYGQIVYEICSKNNNHFSPESLLMLS